MWTNVRAVIRREYVQRVRSKAFVFTTVAFPIFVAAVFVVPMYFATRRDAGERRLVVVDSTGVLYARVAPDLESSGWTVREGAVGDEATATVRRRLEEGEMAGLLVLGRSTLATGEAVLYAGEHPSAVDRVMIRTTIGRAALEQGLEQSGADAPALLQGGELRIEAPSDPGYRLGDPSFLVAYGGAFFLYIVILMYSVAVMRATLEEKTSRIVEVIVSSMKPWHLMLGKILGVGGVSLTQLGIWLLSAALLGSAGIPAVLAARPELLQLGEFQDALPGLGTSILFLGFFLGGFFMYSGLYACVGAMCNTDQEAQQAQAPVVIFVIAPLLMVIPVIERPMTPWSTGLSLFPLFSPILMWARVAGGGIPAWQVALSFVLMAFSVLAIAWVAGRIYKTGILMTGKRPTLPELWRWVKEA